MSVFAQLRGRVGAARLTLAELNKGGELHKVSSNLQANAVIASLKQHGKELTADEKASLCSMITTAGFVEKDATSILNVISNSLPAKARREAQNHVGFLQYLSTSEWSIATHGLDAAINVFIKVLVHRLGCVNAGEPTLKRLTAAALVVDHGDCTLLTEATKIATLRNIKTRYRRTARIVKEKQTSDMPYIVDLPEVPSELEALFPDRIDHFKVEGCWTQPVINLTNVCTCEATFVCRSSSISLPVVEAGMNQSMMQCMMMMI